MGPPVFVSPTQLDDRVELLQGEVEAKTQGIKVRLPIVCSVWSKASAVQLAFKLWL